MNQTWIFIFIITGIGLTCLFLVLSHDIVLQSNYVNNLHSEWIDNINNTSYCPDLKSWIDHDKDFWFKNDEYYQFVDKYQKFNCDEVLKK